jgi:two-component system LytT family response regulator
MDVMKYRILIVDDEDSGRQTMRILLEKSFWPYIQSIDYSKSFDEAQNKIIKSEFDLVFLDINLKGISAFDLLRFIPSTTKVIFVTAYSEFMLKALRNKAFDYLVKPVKEEDLTACLERLRKESEQESEVKCIYVKVKGITNIVDIGDIIYIEGDGPYSIFHLKTETLKTAKTLKLITPEVNKSFVRIHKSYLVNKKYIKGFNMDKLILYNEKWLPVSRTGFKNLSGL